MTAITSYYQWILEEIAALSSGEEDFLKAIRRVEKRLPALLGFLQRLEKKAREAVLSFPADLSRFPTPL